VRAEPGVGLGVGPLEVLLEYILGDFSNQPEGWSRLDYMSAYLIEEAPEPAPYVHLGRSDDSGVNPTLDEARQLGKVLVDPARHGRTS
jgi:hypothetical protein